MPAPPPHSGPCKRCGGTEDVSALGRYRGLCAECRPLVAAEQAQARATRIGRGQESDGMEEDVRAAGESRKPKLAYACKGLVARAERLEKAIDKKRIAHREAQASLSEFKAQIALVGRVAQTLINVSASVAQEDARKDAV